MRRSGDAWFLAAAAIVALIGGAMAVFLATKAGEGSSHVRELQSYHFEAVVTSSTSSRTRLVRAWYQAPDNLRIEVGPDGEAPSIYVIDGNVMHVYDADSNTYYDRAKPDDALLTRGNTTLALGPLPDETLAAYFDAQQGGTWYVSGKDRLLGRSTEIVERDLRNVSEGTFIRYWVDPRYLFVMRYEASAPDAKTTWEPTLVEYNAKVDPGLFEFRAPAGAREVQSPSFAAPQTGPSGFSSYTLPPGFLMPAYVPDGYVAAVVSQSITSGSSGSSGKIIVRYNARSASGGASSYLLIDQTLGTARDLGIGGQQVDINGTLGLQTESGGVRQLAWTVSSSISGQSLTVVLTSNSISADELLKVARSMQ